MSDKDIAQLREAYEDSLFRYLMAGYAIEYGKKLKIENDELKEDFTPTPEAIKTFDRTLNKALRSRSLRAGLKTTYAALRKVSVFIVALLVACVVIVTTVEAARIEVLNFLIGIQDEYTSIRLDDSKGNNIVGDNLYVSWSNSFVPTYVPDGYRIVNITNAKNMKTVLFQNEEEKSIIYSEDSASAVVNIDTENAYTENVKINGYDALFVEKEGVLSVAWSDGQRIFVIVSQLERDELLRVAENVKYVE